MFGTKQAASENSTVIAQDCIINGTVNAEGLLRVDGNVTGELNVNGALIIGPQAVINANIIGKKVVIAGKVTGDVTTQEGLELESTAKLKGNIKTRSLKIAAGAEFSGSSTLLENDRLAEKTATEKTATEKTATGKTAAEKDATKTTAAK
jgi:cytoskeletal protein CcmA (bactofilin family)